MPKTWNLSTSMAPEESHIRFSRHGSQHKPKLTLRSGKSSGTVSRLPLANLPNIRTSNHRPGARNRMALLPKLEQQASNDKGVSKLPNESREFESKIRSALSRSASLGTAGSPPPKPVKSVKFDPAVVFCSDPHTPRSISTQDNKFQTCLEAILKCKKTEREDLLILLNTLTKVDIEDKKPDVKTSKRSTLNPRAPSFRDISSLKAPLSSRTLGTETPISTTQSAPRRKFHPRTALSKDIFEPQSSVQGEVSNPQTTANQQFPNILPHTDFNNSTRIHQPLVNLPSQPLNKKIRQTHQRQTHQSQWIFPATVRSLQCDPVVYPNLSADPFDDSGAGRVALAIEPFWAQAILVGFMQKYPLTGLSSPNLPAMLHGQHTAEVQQQLEFILMQKREIEALTSGP
jgi:hypothetical protein